LVMILRNEAHNLRRSLAAALPGFDEAVVVDTGSSDGTPGACARLGARVYSFAWRDDFAAARNFSLQKARADWLFWLDGDNAISPADVALLRRRIAGLSGPAILWARERVVPGGGSLWQKRCFPRRPEVFFRGLVHEQLVHPPDWPSIRTEAVVRHWGYADPDRVREKGLYYLKLLEKMLADDPRDFYAHFQAARCLLNLRRHQEAARHLEILAQSPEARRANPEIWAQGHFLLAQARQRMGQKDQAEEILDKLLESQPDYGPAHYWRGRLAYSRGEWALAAGLLGRARELGPGSGLLDDGGENVPFLAAFFQGRALERLGRPEKAAACLARAAALDPDNPAPRTSLANLLMTLGRLDQAREELKRALELSPGDRAAQRLRQRLEEAA